MNEIEKILHGDQLKANQCVNDPDTQIEQAMGIKLRRYINALRTLIPHLTEKEKDFLLSVLRGDYENE